VAPWIRCCTIYAFDSGSGDSYAGASRILNLVQKLKPTGSHQMRPCWLLNSFLSNTMSILYDFFPDRDICMQLSNWGNGVKHTFPMDASLQDVLTECVRLGSWGFVQVKSGKGQYYLIDPKYDHATLMAMAHSDRGTHPQGTDYNSYIRRP